MEKKMPTLEDVFKAKKRIDGMIWETPLWESSKIAEDFGANSVFLKLECLQNTGAFKVRGAANKILSLTKEEKKTWSYYIFHRKSRKGRILRCWKEWH